MNNTIPTYSRGFYISGLILILFSVFNEAFLENPDIGNRINRVNLSFTSSTLFLSWGIFRILLGYFYNKLADKLQLNLTRIRLHFLLTLCGVFIFMCVPILDTYLPTDEIKGSILFTVISLIMVISIIGLMIGIIVFYVNILGGLVRIVIKK